MPWGSCPWVMRGSPPLACPTTLCVWRNLPYLTRRADYPAPLGGRAPLPWAFERYFKTTDFFTSFGVGGAKQISRASCFASALLRGLECRSMADEERPVRRALVVLPPRHMTAAPRHYDVTYSDPPFALLVFRTNPAPISAAILRSRRPPMRSRGSPTGRASC